MGDDGDSHQSIDRRGCFFQPSLALGGMVVSHVIIAPPTLDLFHARCNQQAVNILPQNTVYNALSPKPSCCILRTEFWYRIFRNLPRRPCCNSSPWNSGARGARNLRRAPPCLLQLLRTRRRKQQNGDGFLNNVGDGMRDN
jgi:hypothetical protein